MQVSQSRTRRRSASQAGNLDEEYEPMKSTRTSRTAKPTTKATIRRQKPAHELMANPKYKLYHSSKNSVVTDLLTSPDTQALIEAKRPELTEKFRALLNTPGGVVKAAANFQFDGAAGRYDPEWLQQAQEAYERHKKGDFDEFIKWKITQDWPELAELEEAEAAKAAREEEDRANNMKVTDGSTSALINETNVVKSAGQGGYPKMTPPKGTSPNGYIGLCGDEDDEGHQRLEASASHNPACPQFQHTLGGEQRPSLPLTPPALSPTV